MPEHGVKLLKHSDVLSFEEIAEVVKHAVKLGIYKIKLTGGEPLVRKGVLHLIEMLASIEGIRDLGMTTNGVLFSEFAQDLKLAGLHRINFSLDAINAESYKNITRGGDVAIVLNAIELAIKMNFTQVKLNCVIENSIDEKNAQGVLEYANNKNIPVRFIKKMKIDEGTFWPVHGGDGGNCSECNRLRLSSDGNIFPCLFNNISYNVRKLGAVKALTCAVQQKPQSGEYSHTQFYQIGG